MAKRAPAFNAARFDDQIDDRYAQLWGPGARLKRERKDRVKWLRKKHKDHMPSLVLADQLDACKSNTRCKSGACPECSYAARELVTRVTRRFLKEQQSNSGQIVCVSIVPADGASKPGQLVPDQHVRNIRRWKQALGRAGVTWFIGGSDWSANEHAEDRYDPHWCHHIYGFTATNDIEKLKHELRRHFPKTVAIPRPVKVVPWDGDNAAIRYMVKPNFWRRVGTDDAQRFDNAKGKQRSCRATDKQRLRSTQNRELLLHLDQIGLQGRLFMRWLQIVHRGVAGSAVVERGPKFLAMVEPRPKVSAVGPGGRMRAKR